MDARSLDSTNLRGMWNLARRVAPNGLQCRLMINKPPPFMCFFVIPIITPTKGRGFINSRPTFYITESKRQECERESLAGVTG